jgi:hypothetical protein
MNLQKRTTDAKELDELLQNERETVAAYHANLAADALPDVLLESMRQMISARMAVEKHLDR